jgi:hypothetical protein
MRTPLLHSKLQTNTPLHWPTTCTIQAYTFAQSMAGQSLPTGLTDVAGLADIPCRLAPYIENIITDPEMRSANVTETIRRRTAKLNGIFPTIDGIRMIALIEGIVYQIRGVDFDSQSFSTRLRLEVVKPRTV